jgi:inner membrane protein
MDSLTQMLLGASVAALAVPSGHRRRALVAGAALATLPDLDVIPLAYFDDPVTRMTWHRGPSHSLLVLAPFGWLVWAWLRSFWTPVREAPGHWLAAILVALLTHPLLDAFTVYGTQVLWPLPMKPVMWSTLFIIDPAYTLPLLIGVVAAVWLGEAAGARRWLIAGVALSCAYVGWSAVAKAMVATEAERSLAAIGLADAPRFSVPMPFNTLLWRVVALTPDGFVEGEHSLVADDGPIRFRHHGSDAAAFEAVAEFPAVKRLAWFNHGFMKAEVRDAILVLSDLRMGSEPDYTFRFAVAERGNPGWLEVSPEQLRIPWESSRRLGGLWERIWNTPESENR